MPEVPITIRRGIVVPGAVRRFGAGFLFVALLVAPDRVVGEPDAAVASLPRPSLLFGEAYPIETGITLHAALLHWLDSLAALAGPGMTAGKTVEAHRMDFRQLLGEPTERDMHHLRRYALARTRLAAENNGSAKQLTVAFFEEPTVKTAFERVQPLLDDQLAADLRQSIDHFTVRYRAIWRDGRGPRQFLRRALAAPEREAVAEFLQRVERFYGVDGVKRPLPRLVLTPVRQGHGTHAQAVGRNLLIEVRQGESLTDQVGPIVHENAHFLFGAIDLDRRAELRAHAASVSEDGLSAWKALKEALPTALAQGAAEQRFLRSWSARNPWYHREEVDRYAKAIFPLVEQALADGSKFDEAFVRQAVEVY